ncbi:uncharacterized protein DFL_004435 [Arthrobotrys flagrans]|uniref:Uncharacterized protein n=1 Tax=Arthrobotrys flagrans TaxID=97331 RepID=A0A437A4X1_ARTFL|nr:hypothetical protein DFL_004435 [Arthrobotrys flagrans]
MSSYKAKVVERLPERHDDATKSTRSALIVIIWDDNANEEAPPRPVASSYLGESLLSLENQSRNLLLPSSSPTSSIYHHPSSIDLQLNQLLILLPPH